MAVGIKFKNNDGIHLIHGDLSQYVFDRKMVKTDHTYSASADNTMLRSGTGGHSHEINIYTNTEIYTIDNLSSEPLVFMYVSPNPSYTGVNNQPPTPPYVVDYFRKTSANSWELSISSLATMGDPAQLPFGGEPGWLVDQIETSEVELYVFKKISNSDNGSDSPLKLYDDSNNLVADLAKKPLITKRIYESSKADPTRFTRSMSDTSAVQGYVYDQDSWSNLENSGTWGSWGATVANNIGDSSLDSSGGSTGIQKPAMMISPGGESVSFYQFWTRSYQDQVTWFRPTISNPYYGTTAGGHTSLSGGVTYNPTVEWGNDLQSSAGGIGTGTTTGLALSYGLAKLSQVIGPYGVMPVWVSHRLRVNTPVHLVGYQYGAMPFTYNAASWSSPWDFLYTSLRDSVHCNPESSSGELTSLFRGDDEKTLPIIDGADYD